MRGQQTDDGGRYPKVGENASRRHRSRPVFKRFSVLFGEMQFSASTQECDRCQRINVTQCQWWRYFSAEIGPAATKTFHRANLQFLHFVLPLDTNVKSHNLSAVISLTTGRRHFISFTLNLFTHFFTISYDITQP
jgi:hypothetical protein